MCSDIISFDQNICFMNQYMALGRAGVVGHLVQPRAVVEPSLDQEHVQVRNLLTVVNPAQVPPQKNLRVTQMDVQVY